MNITLIVPGGVDESGQERVIPALLWLIQRLASRHRLLVVALNQYPQPRTYSLLGARVVNLGAVRSPLPEARLPVRLGQLQAVWRRYGLPDVVHAFWAQESGVLAGLAGRWRRRPVVLSLGGGEMAWLPQIRYGFQGRRRHRLRVAVAVRLATAVTAGSRYALAPLPATAHWLPLGADAVIFRAPVARPAGPPWRLAHVASLNRVKDPDTLLHALVQVQAKTPGVTLDWVGQDTLGGQVQAGAHRLGLDGAITFHGFLPTPAVAALLRRAHLFIQSSQHESQGVAVCEAALAGAPTVGTAVGLVAELAPAAAAAVPPQDPAALAAAVLQLLRRPARRLALAGAAQAWASRHDADWTAARFEALYEAVRR